MEKLIELLNEYEKELNTGLNWRIDEKYWMLWRWLNLMWVDQYLISKHYWFIKWLVENDKIDRDEIIINSDFMPIAFDRKWEKYEWSEEKQLLMLLSISDTPIEDLVSYLK